MAKKPIKVSQTTIDKIKKMGMTAALKKAGTSSNAEYIEGIKRMYGARRLAAAQANKSYAKSPKVSERTTPTKSPKAAELSLAGMKKPPAGKSAYYYTDAEKKYVRKFGKPSTSNKASSSTKSSGVFAEPGKARGRVTVGPGYFKN